MSVGVLKQLVPSNDALQSEKCVYDNLPRVGALIRSFVVISSAAICMALAGCADADDESEEVVASSDQPEKVYPHEKPGAVVIWPALNPDMVYDPETKRVTDTRTGTSFGAMRHMRSGGLYSAGIKGANGEPGYEYRLRYHTKKVDGETVLTIWEVFWAVRAEDAQGNMGTVQIPGREKAKNDSIEKLAQFLRARRRGIVGEKHSDAVVVVDRRMDDTRAERIY